MPHINTKSPNIYNVREILGEELKLEGEFLSWGSLDNEIGGNVNTSSPARIQDSLTGAGRFDG
jgi:hypothetical protein